MAKGYYRFNNGIYPRQLYVAVGLDEDDVNSMFLSYDGSVKFDWDGCDAVEFDELKERSSGHLGSLVVFHSRHEMTPKLMSHEAVHVLESYMDAFGIERVEKGNNEHLSYLMGWIVGCMDEVRRGKAEIVLPVEKKTNKRKDRK